MLSSSITGCIDNSRRPTALVTFSALHGVMASNDTIVFLLYLVSGRQSCRRKSVGVWVLSCILNLRKWFDYQITTILQQ